MWPNGSLSTSSRCPTSWHVPSPGIREPRWLIRPTSRSRLVSRCSLLILTRRGSGDPTRTGTGWSDSSFPKEPTCRFTAKPTSTRSHVSSTRGHARHSAGTPQPTDSTNSLRPPLESAAADRHKNGVIPVSYTHLRAHETDSYLVCRLL